MDDRILVIHPGSLGDVVLSLPALRALKQAHPMAVLDLIGSTAILELLKGRFYADRVISIDRGDVTSCLADLENFSGSCGDTFKEYNLVVNWLGSKERGFSHDIEDLRSRRVLAARPVSHKTARQHRINIFLESLSSLQIPIPFSLPQIFLSPEDRKLGEAALFSSGMVLKERDILAIHPGSGGRHKCWEFTRFMEISRQAKEHLGLQPLFILGPGERGFVPKLKNTLGRDVPILDGVPLPILAGALSMCRMFLGNDSGVTHLAAALAIPTVAIFGPTDPHLWGPLGRHVRVISKRIKGKHIGENICQGCDCLGWVSVKDVIGVLSQTALDYSAAIC
jgi:ADP-heptose:LPS heptosyltransferase